MQEFLQRSAGHYGRIWNPPLRCRGRCSSSTRKRCDRRHVPRANNVRPYSTPFELYCREGLDPSAGRCKHRPLQKRPAGIFFPAGRFSLVILVIIDQAAVRQDPALCVGHRAELDGELHQTAVRLDGHGVQLVRGLQQGLADAGQVDVIAVVQRAGVSPPGTAACPSLHSYCGNAWLHTQYRYWQVLQEPSGSWLHILLQNRHLGVLHKGQSQFL